MTEIDTPPVSLDTPRFEEEPEIEITKLGRFGYMWSIPIPGTLAHLTIDVVYPTKGWALWAARRAWRKEQRVSKVETYPIQKENK